MNKTTTLSPLTTMAPALFTCLKLNAFLARRALHLANAQKVLTKRLLSILGLMTLLKMDAVMVCQMIL